jgi:asparagine synthetase B (glutamine-hydrolysing)
VTSGTLRTSRTSRQFSAGSHAGFSALSTPLSTLHHAGAASLPWAEVQASLERGAFPEALRGEFAFVWEGADDTVAAVDHLATIPLFYTDAIVAPLFHELHASLAEPRADPFSRHMMWLLFGHSLGERTTCAQISRLSAGHYLRRGRQVQFIDLSAIPTDDALGPGPLGEVVESALRRCLDPGRPNVLLLSAGTDSVALAGIIRKHGLEPRFDYVHIYSDRQWLTEAPLARQIAAEMGLPLRMVEVRTTAHALPEDEGRGPGRLSAFWLDDYIASKVLGVRAAGHAGSTIFTGELGDQLFGGRETAVLLNQVLARGRVDVRELCTVWLNLGYSFNTVSGAAPGPGIVDKLAREPGFAEVYAYLLDTLAGIFRGASTRDLLNRILLLNLADRGPFRMYAYSQDPMRWAHPFAAWSVVEQALRTPSRWKLAGGTPKAILRTLWGDWVSPIPWETPKSGMRIPVRHRLVTPIEPDVIA